MPHLCFLRPYQFAGRRLEEAFHRTYIAGANLGIRPTPHASAPSFVDSWAPFRAVVINVARIECADPGSTAWKLTIGRVRNRLPNQQTGGVGEATLPPVARAPVSAVV